MASSLALKRLVSSSRLPSSLSTISGLVSADILPRTINPKPRSDYRFFNTKVVPDFFPGFVDPVTPSAYSSANEEMRLQLKMRPGVGKEDIKLTVEKNLLIIKSATHEDCIGSFPLPEAKKNYKLDEIKAVMSNGVLEVVVPKLKNVEMTMPEITFHGVTSEAMFLQLKLGRKDLTMEDVKISATQSTLTVEVKGGKGDGDNYIGRFMIPQNYKGDPEGLVIWGDVLLVIITKVIDQQRAAMLMHHYVYEVTTNLL